MYTITLQDLLNSSLTCKPKGTLYHYTTNEGLLGILDKKNLHFSDYKFLNDKDEFSFGNKLGQMKLLQMISNLYQKAVETKNDSNAIQASFLQIILNEFKDNYEASRKNVIYVGCFTEKGDSLSQWKGYSNFGEGYSIGFSGSKLLKTVQQDSCYYMAKVEYSRKKQEEIILNILTFFAAHFSKDKNRDLWATTVGKYLFLCSCFFKLDEFKEEKEWRIIYFNQSENENEGIGCKSGKFGLHTYKIFPIKLDFIKRIYIGPKYDYNLNLYSIDYITKSKSINVYPSNIRLQ